MICALTKFCVEKPRNVCTVLFSTYSTNCAFYLFLNLGKEKGFGDGNHMHFFVIENMYDSKSNMLSYDFAVFGSLWRCAVDQEG